MWPLSLGLFLPFSHSLSLSLSLEIQMVLGMRAICFLRKIKSCVENDSTRRYHKLQKRLMCGVFARAYFVQIEYKCRPFEPSNSRFCKIVFTWSANKSIQKVQQVYAIVVALITLKMRLSEYFTNSFARFYRCAIVGIVITAIIICCCSARVISLS